MVRAFGWGIIAPGLTVAAACAILAMRMQPPAVAVAVRCTTAAAILLMAKLVAWVARSGDRFRREEWLLAFVMFVAIVLTWIGVRERIGEAMFDYQVAQQ